MTTEVAGKKPVSSEKKPERKMIPESDLLAVKTARDKLREELANVKVSLVEAKSALKIAKMDGEDDVEVSKVKDFLISEETRINELRATLDGDLTSFKARELEVGAKGLALKYGIDVESISGEESVEVMTTKALEFYAERLAGEKKELEDKIKTPESVFESTPGGMVVKGVWDKTQEEFDKDFERQKQEALAKR